MYSTSRGFAGDDLPPIFISKSIDFLKTHRRGTQFDKAKYLEFIDSQHDVVFTKPLHKKIAYDFVTKNYLSDIQSTDNPWRISKESKGVHADIFEALLGIVYDIGAEMSHDQIIEKFGLAVDHDFPGLEPSRDDLEFALWAWNASIWQEDLNVSSTNVLSTLYKELDGENGTAIFESYDEAVLAVRESYENLGWQMRPEDINLKAQFFVELHPPRKPENEHGTPYSIGLKRRVDATAQVVKPASLGQPAEEGEKKKRGPPKGFKQRENWKWDKITRERALEWVRANGVNSASFTNACLAANPPWVIEEVHKEQACANLLTHIKVKLRNDKVYAARKTKPPTEPPVQVEL